MKASDIKKTPFTNDRESTLQFIAYIKYLKDGLIALREHLKQQEAS